MAFTTVPTPLWSLYAQRDRFSSLTVTIVFAVYALAVALSLFLVGHLSDWYGRRRVLMPALALEILAARGIRRLAVSAGTAARSGAERPRHRRGDRDGDGLDVGAGRRRISRRAQVVATAANLGGLGLGALISGALAQWAGDPLRVPFVVFAAALVLAWLALLAAPETRERPSPRPRYRPQRVSVPARSRGRFFAAALGAAIAFAVFGLSDLARAELPRRHAASALACAGGRRLVRRVRHSRARADADGVAQHPRSCWPRRSRRCWLGLAC